MPQVLNPLEKDDVVGITNYVDLGIKVWGKRVFTHFT